ncbi:MAG: cupin domain-containing protein [Pseudomonadales bacterium]
MTLRCCLSMLLLAFTSACATRQLPIDTMPARAQALIEAMGMERIPHEGAWFTLTHVSDETLQDNLPARYTTPRKLYSAIHTLVTESDFSAMHRLNTDEFWMFYEGAPMEVLLLYPDGSGATKILGAEVLNGQHRQLLVPRNTWMGARLLNSAPGYALFGNILAPGFDYSDYQSGYRDALIRDYPAFAEQITALTRTDSLTAPQP